VGLAGESGCGKSTIVQLLYRFYEANFGEIFIDGHNIKTYNVKALRLRLGLVQQEPILFDYPISENIAYGKNDCKNSEIFAAAKDANALEFIQDDKEIKMDPEELAKIPKEDRMEMERVRKMRHD
jgi:ABC-type multidrug transport system fused ATPase/permease subunit